MRSDSFKSLNGELRPGQEHHKTWYVVALAEDIKQGAVIGRNFLNGRVAIYRKLSGEPVVVTSVCPHMGADLSLGDVVDDNLRCTYHHFCFDSKGACSSVPSQGPIPPAAKIFSYPCVERFGLIWAFNGEEAMFPPPGVRDYNYENLVYRPRKTDIFSVAPWVNIGNVFDFMHLKYVHNLAFEYNTEKIRWLDDFHIENEIEFAMPGFDYESRIRVTGPNTVAYNIVTQKTSIGLFTLTPVGNESHSYAVAIANKQEEQSAEIQEESLAYQEQFSDMLLEDDVRTLTGIKFRVGALVKEDRAMVNFLKWVYRFPTADPASNYL